ncbi:MAG: PTS sugar transporter subunit IIA [Calditrichaeota bacterium]|nr:MAG: PTS sugar transporter subunit IIA [Calditrichota bacterium]MBL1206298.1 PTS sugar transporter subunit IIA [Calditrichota bacterium]NOG46124.1 PTS sugar transporter subunit IIA [Calditrichota bacterium]
MQLNDLLKKENIKIPLEARERDFAIKELIGLMDGQINDSELAFNAVLEREKIMTTGVGNGIAIPHCKHQSCPDFTVALGVAETEIDFASIDNKKVKLVFVLLGPENSPAIHIKLLSRISRLMSNEQIRDQLLSCATAEEAFQLIKSEEENFPEIE